MLYCGYLGPEEHVPSWLNLVHRHADWLKLTAHDHSCRLPDGHTFSFSYLTVDGTPGAIHIHDTPEWLSMTTAAVPDPETHCASQERAWHRLTDFQSNDIRVGVALRSGEVRVAVPPTTPEPFYYRRDDRGYVIADDMRILMRWAPTELDPRGVYALFQYGASPAPLTVCRGIHRVPNGHVLTLSSYSRDAILQRYFDLAEQSQPIRDSPDPSNQLWMALDRTLTGLAPSAVVYFSGGVDSGLMASRLAALGRTDVTLFNYSFGTHDQEARLALQMAAHLGLRCEQATYNPSGLPGMLARLGRDYSFPFSDLSTVPTNLLVHASLASADTSRTVLEGTGADGTFGLGLKYPQWVRVYRIPAPIRRWVSGIYERAGLWRSDSIAGRVGDILRRSVQMPLSHAAVIAHNALDGIAYNTPEEVHEEIENAIHDRIHMMSHGMDERDRFSFLDMVHVCSGLYAVKASEPLRSRGIHTICPFLEPPLLRAGFAIPWDEKCQGGVAKSLLKDMLVRRVPREMVFRPKRGFMPPNKEIFGTSSMQEFIEGVVMSSANPVLAFCDRVSLSRIVEGSRRGEPLSTGVYQFLWSLTFFSGWLRQLELSQNGT